MSLRKKHWFHEWLISKAGLQVFALILGLTAWAFVNSGKNIREKRTIKIQYLQIPKGLVFQRTPIKQVKVDLEGSLYHLRSVHDDDLVYIVDLSNFKSGAHRIEIEPDILRLPLDVEAKNLSPQSIAVHLEEIMTRSLPVKALFTGNLKEGYSVRKAYMRPEVVSVSGPVSIVSKMETLEVEVSLQNHEASFSVTAAPHLSFPATEALENITVDVEVSAVKSTRELKDVPVVAQVEKASIKISPPVATLTLEGPEGEYPELFRQLKVSIPTESLKRGRYRIRGESVVPPPFKLEKMEPQTFIVEVLE